MKTFYSQTIIFSFLISLFLLSCTMSEKKESDLTKMRLHGNIKSSITKQYFATQSFGEIDKDSSALMMISEREFNKSGNITMYKRIQFGADNDTSDFSHKTYLYNENQEIIEIVKYNDIGRKVESSLFLYDEIGNNIKSTFYEQDGSINFVLEKKYNENQQLESQQHYESDGTASISWMFKYDNLGNNIEKNTFYISGELMYTNKRKYDTHNNMIEDIKYDNLGSVRSKEISQYNEKGRFLLFYSEIEHTEEGEDTWSIEYEYVEVDEQENWITSTNTDVSNFCTVSNRIFEYY